jgi:hypothetical protein
MAHSLETGTDPSTLWMDTLAVICAFAAIGSLA